MSEESKANWLKLAWNRDPLTFLLTLFTGLLVFFTGFQAHILTDATRISERAWVTVKSVQFSNITVGQKPAVTITAENTGKSPAAGFTNNNLIALIGIPLQPGPMPLSQPLGRPSVGVLGPGMDFNFTVQLEHTVTADEIESMKGSHLFLYVYGVVRYRDIFGTERYTQYCFEPNPANINGPANVCGQWNTLN